MGQGEKWRFSMGDAAARQARDERMRKEICMIGGCGCGCQVIWMFRVQGRMGKAQVRGLRPQ